MSRAALAALASACATVPVPALTSREGQGEALSAAAEHFYAARTPKELRAAVDAARAAGPDSAQVEDELPTEPRRRRGREAKSRRAKAMLGG